MTLPAYVYVLLISFAGIGLAMTIIWAVKGVKTVLGIVTDLSRVLHEAVEAAKVLRGDFELVRQIASAVPDQVIGEEPKSIIPQNGQSATSFMPPPYFDRFPTRKPTEPDAPPESIKEVDVTPSDEEVADQSKVEDLLSMGIRANPEDQ